MIGHLDHIGREQAGDVGRRRARQFALQIGLPAGQGEAHVAEFAGRGERRRHGNRRSSVAAHGVDGNMERRRHGARDSPAGFAGTAYSSAAAASALVCSTFLPR